jgi:hypothetical protein
MPWEDEPATDRQKIKLTFFGIRFFPTLTKSEAHDLLDKINDPEREKAYRAYRDDLDEKQAAEEDLNIRVGAWQSSLEMRDLDYCRAITDEEVIDVVTYLDKTSPGWEESQRLIFYDTLAQRHPDVLR